MYTKIAAIISHVKERFECQNIYIYIYIYHGDSGKKKQAVKKGNPGKKESKNI